MRTQDECDCPDGPPTVSAQTVVEWRRDDGALASVYVRSCRRCGALFVRVGPEPSWKRVPHFLALCREV